MTNEIRLTADGERALLEAQNLCSRTNVAIVAPEHLLAGALTVLEDTRAPLPGAETRLRAVVMSQGQGSGTLSENVMFGSAAREVINGAAGAVRDAGGDWIDARIIAAACIDSGEVTPMFFAELGMDRQQLLSALAAIEEI